MFYKNLVTQKANVLWRSFVICPLILLSLLPNPCNCVAVQKWHYDEDIKKHEHKMQQIKMSALTYLGQHVPVTLANVLYDVCCHLTGTL